VAETPLGEPEPVDPSDAAEGIIGSRPWLEGYDTLPGGNTKPVRA